MDMEDTFLFVNYVREKSRRSSKLFNVEPKQIDPEAASGPPHKKSKIEYHEQLQKEISEWYQLLSNGKAELKRLQEENQQEQSLTIDILSEDKKMFFLATPNFNEFTKDSKDFINEAKRFLDLTEDHFKWITYLKASLAEKIVDISRDIIRNTNL